MTIPSDMERLLERARRGDRGAEEKIFKFILDRFRIFARHKIGNCEAADDVVQDACAAILKKYKTEVFTTGFEAWAYGVLRMKIRNHFYTQSGNRETTMSDTKAQKVGFNGPAIVDSRLEIRLGVCLKKIVLVKPLYARILNLAYQGYTTDEICERLNIKPNYLYVALNRARRLLRACLETGESKNG